MQTPKLGYSYTLNIPLTMPDYTDWDRSFNGLLFRFVYTHLYWKDGKQKEVMHFKGGGDTYYYKREFVVDLDEFKKIFFLFGIGPSYYGSRTHVVLI
jgi:hypothetical protein